MADLNDNQSALTVKITGSNSSGTETNFIDATANGIKVDGSAVTQPVSAASLPLPTGASTSALQSTGNLILSDINTNSTTIINNQTNGTQRSQITNGSINADITADNPINTANGLVVRNIPKVRETYSACVVNLVVAGSATDIFTIQGSNTKNIYIHKITVSGTRNVHNHNVVILNKRSSINTGGTSTVITAVPHDSNNAPATATVRSYTANPTLGTLVGNLKSTTVSFPVRQPSNAQGNGGGVNPWIWEYSDIGQPITIRGNTQQVGINLNGTSIPGSNINISIEWSEE